MRNPRAHAVVLFLAVGLSACHAQGRAPGDNAYLLRSCGVAVSLKTALAAELAQGRVPEASPMGECVANAAHMGNVAADLVLADAYAQAMDTGTALGSGSAALNLDLFGRHIGWLHMAADRGDPAAQLLLAQETDGPESIDMPDSTLAWYQAAAENGNRPARVAIRTGYDAGRISYDRLYDFRNWLAAQGKLAATHIPRK